MMETLCDTGETGICAVLVLLDTPTNLSVTQSFPHGRSGAHTPLDLWDRGRGHTLRRTCQSDCDPIDTACTHVS